MGHKRLTAPNPASSYPAFLKRLGRSETSKTPLHPILIKMESRNSVAKLEKLVSQQTISEVIDNYAEQFAELLLSRNAHLYRANYSVQVASVKEMLAEHYGHTQHWQKGTWAYFPWSKQLVHILSQTDFEELRTIRNRDLITKEEQAKLFEFEVACFGMSVGSAGAQALALSGISRRIKLVDQAVISGSNLNRVLAGVKDVSIGKATVIGRQIYEMNPYSSIEFFDKIETGNAATIFDKPWPAKLVIDEIDDLEMKIKIRVEARRRKIPVLMASELGDTVVLDVERYDLDPKHDLFHGLVPGAEDLLGKKLANSREWMKHAVSILGPGNMPLRLQKSLLKIGTTIVTHPQLGSTVMMTGGMLAFAVKSIALRGSLASGRYVISLENTLLADHRSRKHKKRHKKHTKVIRKAIESM